MLHNIFKYQILFAPCSIKTFLNMKKIRVLKICFEQEIPSREIPGLRGTIIEKIGRDKILFHNHLSLQI